MTERHDLPNVDKDKLHLPDLGKLLTKQLEHKPRILLLYGSLRELSYSRLVIEESARLLQALGAEAKLSLIHISEPTRPY